MTIKKLNCVRISFFFKRYKKSLLGLITNNGKIMLISRMLHVLRGEICVMQTCNTPAILPGEERNGVLIT